MKQKKKRKFLSKIIKWAFMEEKIKIWEEKDWQSQRITKSKGFLLNDCCCWVLSLNCFHFEPSKKREATFSNINTAHKSTQSSLEDNMLRNG